MLVRAYRYYQHPDGPLVVRSRIALPDEYRKKQWPDVPEYGRYLFIEKGRCRLMDVGMWYPVTGMRVWYVDSIQFGFNTKGGFYKRDPDAFRGADWMWEPCMRVFLRPGGMEIVN